MVKPIANGNLLTHGFTYHARGQEESSPAIGYCNTGKSQVDTAVSGQTYSLKTSFSILTLDPKSATRRVTCHLTCTNPNMKTGKCLRLFRVCLSSITLRTAWLQFAAYRWADRETVADCLPYVMDVYTIVCHFMSFYADCDIARGRICTQFYVILC